MSIRDQAGQAADTVRATAVDSALTTAILDTQRAHTTTRIVPRPPIEETVALLQSAAAAIAAALTALGEYPTTGPVTQDTQAEPAAPLIADE